mmetsp:Transcript_17411/g.47539  ORF Transcript_17411/g.47539 Transcript_17411/m.47539 type:complete len:228 (+) Transcript_17411:1092-1775(+)
MMRTLGRHLKASSYKNQSFTLSRRVLMLWACMSSTENLTGSVSMCQRHESGARLATADFSCRAGSSVASVAFGLAWHDNLRSDTTERCSGQKSRRLRRWTSVIGILLASSLKAQRRNLSTTLILTSSSASKLGPFSSKSVRRNFQEACEVSTWKPSLRMSHLSRLAACQCRATLPTRAPTLTWPHPSSPFRSSYWTVTFLMLSSTLLAAANAMACARCCILPIILRT